MLATSFTNIVLPLLFCLHAADNEPIEDLVGKLGSPRFRIRFVATRQLLTKGPAAIPALQKALRSQDAEVVLRASLILKQLEQRLLKQAKWFVKEGKLDLAVELLARLPNKRYEEECWQVARILAERLSKEYKKPKHGIGFNLQKYGHLGFISRWGKHIWHDVKREKFLLVRAGEVELKPDPKLDKNATGSLMFVTGDVRFQSPNPTFSSSAIFALGSANIGCAYSVIIVSDGDVTIRSLASNCVIIARGTVTCSTMADCVIVSGKTVRRPYHFPNCTIIENATNPLGYIQFFDPTREGITVTKAKGGVRVTKVTAGKPFHKAGLQKGDLITTDHSAGRKADVTSPEVFRRLLRRHFAWQEEMTFRVRRDGKSLTIHVPRPQ